jgi:hypothetical protein
MPLLYDGLMLGRLNEGALGRLKLAALPLGR